jgi:hypothetical protein
VVTNPFRFSGPVDIDNIIDRDSETQDLLEHAREGNNSRLAGPRRFGKTSLLRRLAGEIEAEGWAAVYVDFFGVITVADVAERIERAYTSALTGSLKQWLTGLLRTLKPTGSIGGGPVPASVGVAVTPQTSPLLDRLALPLKVYERSGKRVLVIFDEFQDVLAAQSNVDAVIRSEIQHHGSAASYVFAGSHVGMMNELFTNPGRAFYAQATPIVLPPLPAEATATFIGARFTATGKEVWSALGPLLDATEGHPQRTMLLAHALWAGTPDAGAADEATFAYALAEVLSGLADEFRELWSRTPPSQRRVLAALASGESAYRAGTAAGGKGGGGVTQARAAAAARGDIVEDPAAGWRLVDPLLAIWIRSGRPESGNSSP